MKKTEQAKTLSQLSDEIAELCAHIDAATCRLMDLILEFDQRGGWDEEGARSCVEWLGWRLGWRANTASEHIRVAQALRSLPILHDAFAHGRVSYSKLRAVTRSATPETDAEWLNIALNSTAAQCEKIVRKCRRADEAENLIVENARHDQRMLHTYHDAMGMLVIEGRLPPEVGAVVEKAIETAMRDLRGEESRSIADDAAPEPQVTPAQRRADALVHVAEQSLCGEGPVRTADRFQVMVHVDAEVLADPNAGGRCELDHGPSLSAESLRRLTCDGSLVTVLHDGDGDGDVLNVGRKTRVLSAALRRAVNERDQGCCFPGCNCRVVDGHHVEHWMDGGETKLGNILSLCGLHHRLLHEGGFQVRLDEGGEPVFTRPNGAQIHRSIMPRLFAEPVEAITRWNQEAGLLIDADTNLPEWDGEIPQYDYIAEVMTQLADSRRAVSP